MAESVRPAPSRDKKRLLIGCNVFVRSFTCPTCGRLVFFENSECLHCGTALAYDPSTRALEGLADRPRCVNATIAACKKATKKCDESSECCGDLVCRRANSQNYYDKTETRCCRRIGEHCNQGIECCGVDVICNGNFCQKA